VLLAENGKAAIATLERESVDILISDSKMPDLSGVEVLRAAKEVNRDIVAFMMTAFASTDTAVEAMRLGAVDYFTKPFNMDELRLKMRQHVESQRLKQENVLLKRALGSRHEFSNIIGASDAMRAVFSTIQMVATTSSTVLIGGESGTGKELVARAVHFNSLRRDRPFVALNCGAVPETLLESELFGHVRGAFTGAVADKPGRFEQAHGGTIFLDEIADMSLKTQAKVLRVLQEQIMERVGGTQRIKVDVRVLAATNKDLPAEIRAGRFREDLFFRLNVIPIFVPALRDRPQDIPMLAEHFMALVAQEHGRKPKRLASEAAARLQQYGWPGNVRELRNVIERVNIMVGGDTITAQDLGFLGRDGVPDVPASHGPVVPLSDARDQFEKDYILKVLAEQNGNMSRTAEVLGVERSNLYKKLRAFGITPRGGT